MRSREHQLRLRLAQIGERLAELAVDRGELDGALLDLLLELLARAAHLVVEPRVLDRGAGLVGERRHQAQIGVGELARILGARDREHAEDAVLLLERHRDAAGPAMPAARAAAPCSRSSPARSRRTGARSPRTRSASARS